MRPPGGGALAEARVFEAIKSFVTELADGHKAAGDLDDGDFRLAFAALLVHAASVDGEFNAPERAKLTDLLKQRFELDDASVDELVAQAIDADQKAIDLYHFTHLLNGKLDDTGRLRMIEMMWQLAYSDGAVSDYEDNLIWRVADLLGVPSRERIALRQRVAAPRGGGP
jgi:uncharacterized tellurite resistance protein B-like protein